MFPELMALGAFLVVAVLVFIIGDTVLGGNRRRSQLSSTVTGGGDVAETTPGKRNQLPWIVRLLTVIIPQAPVEIEGIERDLKRGGFYEPTALAEYLASRNALMVLVGLLTAFIAWDARTNPELQRTVIIVGAVVAILGYGLPRMLLRSQANARVRRIQLGLPDALDVITMCLTGGLPLQDALSRVTEELQYSHPDIAAELEIIRKQAGAHTMAQALRQFATRIDVPDVKAMSAIVGQTERLGTNVAIAVRDFADSLRRGARHRAEERASKTTVKMLFPVVLCLAPPVYILLCGPAILQLREFVLKENRPGGILSPNTPNTPNPGLVPQARQGSISGEGAAASNLGATAATP